MFPKRLLEAPRILLLTLVITFISGANFFSIIMFWPTQAYNVYGHDPIGVGIRGLPVGFAILTGACVVLWLLSIFKGGNKELMIASSVLMTAGMFILKLEFWLDLANCNLERCWIPRCCDENQSRYIMGTSGTRWTGNWWYRRSCKSLYA
jgi:hypothetical protein